MVYNKPLDSPPDIYSGDKDKFNATHVEQLHEDASDLGPRGGYYIRTAEEKHAELRAAQMVDPGLSPWSYRGFTFALTILCV